MITYNKQITLLDKHISQTPPNSDEIDEVKELLGRTPDGLHRIIKKNDEIITVLSDTFVRQRPFPTMFWLVNKDLIKKISAIESSGIIKELEKDKDIQDLVEVDNKNYAKLRTYFHETLHEKIDESSSYYPTVYLSGAGGIQDHRRIRCFHLHMAYHYSVGSNLGNYLINKYPELKI